MHKLKALFIKLFTINDTPQKIAIGFGLGVFFGVMPGVGVLAAIFFAVLFKVNRASAILGSLFTNTWLSFVTFIIAVKIGAKITNSNWKDIYDNYKHILTKFHWQDIFNLSFVQVILPVIIGFIITSLIAGLLAYCLALIVISIKNRKTP